MYMATTRYGCPLCDWHYDVTDEALQNFMCGQPLTLDAALISRAYTAWIAMIEGQLRSHLVEHTAEAILSA